MEGKIRQILREYYGEFETTLETAYVDTITKNLLENDYQHRMAWATYNQVILELKLNPKNKGKLNELQYKLSDNEDPNDVCIQILEDLNYTNEELDRLYIKILNFV